MRDWDAARVGAAAGGSLVRAGAAAGGPARVVIDSRAIAPGDLFVALPGERADGGRFAAEALAAGAWGVLVAPSWAEDLSGGAIIAAGDPLAALGSLARAWRRTLGAQVIAVTGSVGKTSTKDLLAALVAPHRTVAASRANFNTEIGLPLELLAAPPGTDVLVLELAMRGFGQIAELAAICEPDVGVITNLGPVHLEQMGSLEGVARAKAELLEGMRDGAVAVVPVDEPRLDPWLRDGLQVVRFGAWAGDPPLGVPFSSPHQLRNLGAAVAAARAVGVEPSGPVEVRFSALRGERVALALGATVINDCYNANPLSMRAALDDLARQETSGRRVAVLGDMLELGPGEREEHRAVGAYAAHAGVELLVAVGPRSEAMLEGFGPGRSVSVPDAAAAAAVARELVVPGDTILVKASRGVGLERVAEALVAMEAVG